MKKSISVLLLLALCVFAFAACNKNNDALKEAGEYLYGIYKDDSEVTPSDYDVAGRVTVGDTVFTVEWSVDVTEGVTIKESTKEGFYTVDVNEKTDKDIPYVLTATIKDEKGNSVQKTFNRKVPKYAVATYAEYAAAADDTALVVEGIVAGIFSKSNGSSANGLYLQDLNGDGGYYLYNMEKDPSADLGIKVGMTLSATGTKDTYNGTYELVSATVEIIDSTVKTVEPVDYTEVFKSATALTDTSLVGKQSMLVTIKGVEITGSDESNGYYKFKLGDLETYIRISSSNNCISKDEITAVKAAHGEHFSYSANVTGIVSIYSGSFYLIPASADVFEYLSIIEKTPAEKVEIEKGSLSVLANATENTVVTLPSEGTNYSDVKIAWTVSESTAAVYDAATGNLTITLPDVAEKITLTATITCEGESATVTFEMEIDAKSTMVYSAEVVTAPVTGEAYKLSLYQGTNGERLYFIGETDPSKDYYLATSNKAEKAADVYLEAVDGVTGGYRLYFNTADGVKTYIEVYEYADTKGSIRLVTTVPEAYYTYSTEFNTLVYTSTSGNSFYMGTYSSYTTVSASNTSYITSSNVDVSQFPVRFVTLKEVEPTVAKADPAVDTPFKLLINQVKAGKELYFTGTTEPDKDYYLSTSEKLDKAVDIYLEAVDGVDNGYRIYFNTSDNVKTYIEVYEYTEGKGSIRLVTTKPETYFTYNSDFSTFVYTATSGNSFYMGTYNTYETVSASNTSYITSSNVDVSQFPVRIVSVSYES